MTGFDVVVVAVKRSIMASFFIRIVDVEAF